MGIPYGPILPCFSCVHNRRRCVAFSSGTSARCVLLCLRRNCHRRSPKWKQVSRGGMVMSIISALSSLLLLIYATFVYMGIYSSFVLLSILLLLIMVIVPTISASLTCKPLCCQKGVIQPNQAHYQPNQAYYLTHQVNQIHYQPNQVRYQPN